MKFISGSFFAGRPSRLYGDIDSRFSPHTQAADIAAGFACEAYDRNHIRQVVDDFDFVTLNGERLTEQNVTERVGYWSELLEREKRYQKFLNS